MIIHCKERKSSAGSATLGVASLARLIIQLKFKTEPSVAKAHNYIHGGGHSTEIIEVQEGRGGTAHK